MENCVRDPFDKRRVHRHSSTPTKQCIFTLRRVVFAVKIIDAPVQRGRARQMRIVAGTHTAGSTHVHFHCRICRASHLLSPQGAWLRTKPSQSDLLCKFDEILSSTATSR